MRGDFIIHMQTPNISYVESYGRQVNSYLLDITKLWRFMWIIFFSFSYSTASKLQHYSNFICSEICERFACAKHISALVKLHYLHVNLQNQISIRARMSLMQNFCEASTLLKPSLETKYERTRSLSLSMVTKQRFTTEKSQFYLYNIRHNPVSEHCSLNLECSLFIAQIDPNFAKSQGFKPIKHFVTLLFQFPTTCSTAIMISCSRHCCPSIINQVKTKSDQDQQNMWERGGSFDRLVSSVTTFLLRWLLSD